MLKSLLHVTFWGPGTELLTLRCFPLTALQPATSLGNTDRLSNLSGLMPKMTGAALLATAATVMCSSGWSKDSEAEGTAAAGSSRPPPAAPKAVTVVHVLHCHSLISTTRALPHVAETRPHNM